MKTGTIYFSFTSIAMIPDKKTLTAFDDYQGKIKK
jgi:hypothetical protein